MRIYVVHGYGCNPSESDIETYAIVCTSREGAENQFNMIMKEQVMMAKSETCYGVQYVETLCKRNGKIHHYHLETVYDLKNSAQKEAFLWSTKVIGGNIKNDEFCPVFDDDNRPELRIMTQASISIREQEI